MAISDHARFTTALQLAYFFFTADVQTWLHKDCSLQNTGG